ncbi:hypothetical protein [uncultured Propionibacterium sp.]|nr:hypothetical protein [uncultured Propionibacterium sp.]
MMIDDDSLTELSANRERIKAHKTRMLVGVRAHRLQEVAKIPD